MPTLRQVTDVLETLYPLRYAESWDAPGLIVGMPDQRVETIAFAADPTMAVIDEAIARGADLLVCHHPLLFRSVHAVSGSDVHGAIVGKLYQNRCALWVGHTNADAAWRGVGQAAADMFGLVNQRPLVPINDPQSVHPVGLGRVGELEELMTLESFARKVAAVLPHTELGVQVCGDLQMPVKKVAVLPGSGDSLFDEVRASGVDVYVTSDLRHHPATDAIERARYEAVLRKAISASAAQSNSDDIHAHTLQDAVQEVIDNTSVDDTGNSNDGFARPALINTPHSAIESLWFHYAPDDITQAVFAATGSELKTTWIDMNTDPWSMVIHN